MKFATKKKTENIDQLSTKPLKEKSKFGKFFDRNSFFIFVVIAIEISIISAMYFIFLAGNNLAYIDANTRLNTARRIFDNLTPGMAQIGSVWPPFPQILFLPFVVSNYLWHSGIAAWFISGAAYVIAGILIYKTLKLITSSNVIAFFGGLFYILNINLIYLQTTAMSESFFLMCMVGILYSFTKYIKTEKVQHLLLGAAFAFLASLTRYEGYAIIIGSFLILGSIFFIRKISFKRMEGTFILYAVPACLGIFLWTIYLWAIFGDPLYWLHYYGVIAVAPTQVIEVHRPSYLTAASVYATSVVYMSGVFTALLGVIGFFYTFFSKKDRKYTYLLFFPLMIIVFMIGTLSKNTVIDQPQFSLLNFFNKNLEFAPEYNNIRYGLTFFPFLALFAFVAARRSKVILFAIVLLLSFQVVNYFYFPLELTFQLRKNVDYKIFPVSIWMREHYDGGLILVSAAEHDTEMSQFNLPYKTYIHEGTQQYWNESMHTSSKYAKWIVMLKDSSHSIPDKEIMSTWDFDHFKLVYSDDRNVVYKLPTKPIVSLESKQ